MDDLTGSTPAADYIYVKDQDLVTPSGLTVPLRARQGGHMWGEVLAVGPGRWSETGGPVMHGIIMPEPHPVEMDVMPYYVGQHVYYSVGAGIQDQERDGIKVRVIRPHDIVALK